MYSAKKRKSGENPALTRNSMRIFILPKAE